MQPAAIEVVRFTVDPADTDKLLAEHPRFAVAVRENCEGLRSLKLLRVDERTWIDVAEWETRAHALKAAEALPELPACRPLFALIDEGLSMDVGEIAAQD
ncbi:MULTISPECIES: antibiotic biosynthesis monooxygenase [Streptomyces]|uniref:Antibiotic biosynthesis monooxygenase n=1 Tax=Streptomyces sudanensis TaxID=436397 RepID=A0ABY4T786_9ACTN|nr:MULTISPECIES: antibiotic biosynthesis monooxygenase [Streptomyces]URN14823.1 antibiotic biosynthesis monooxygenase [Streptomyces sudanensis]